MVLLKKRQLVSLIAPPGASEDQLRSTARTVQFWADRKFLLPIGGKTRGKDFRFDLLEARLAIVCGRLKQMGLSSFCLEQLILSLRTDHERSATSALDLALDPVHVRRERVLIVLRYVPDADLFAVDSNIDPDNLQQIAQPRIDANEILMVLPLDSWFAPLRAVPGNTSGEKE